MKEFAIFPHYQKKNNNNNNNKYQLNDNESDLDFTEIRTQCKNKYHIAVFELLDENIEKFNAFKNGQTNFQLLSLAAKS